MRRNRIIMNVIISALIGVAIAWIIKSINGVKDIQSATVFVVELNENVLPGQLITIESLLKDIKGINKGSVEMITASIALEEMKAEMPELAYMADNPFRDLLTFRFSQMKSEEVTDLIKDIEAIPGVDDVYYDQSFMETLSASTRSIRIGLVLISMIILLGSVIILALRIKRDVRAYTEEVQILTLAGAKEDQIIKDRMNFSVKWGGLSAFLASLLVALNIIFINNTLLDGLEITFLQSIIAIVVMMAIVVSVHAAVSYQSMLSYFSNTNLAIKK